MQRIIIAIFTVKMRIRVATPDTFLCQEYSKPCSQSFPCICSIDSKHANAISFTE